MKKTVYLPQELIIQILLKLPVKSLLRFRCVSKSWLSLISDSHFALSHYDLAAARSCRLVVVACFDSDVRAMDLDASLGDDSAPAALNLHFLPFGDHYDVEIVGSCRGFLLLALKPDSSLYVWNPSSGVHKQIPLPVNPLCFTFLYGFGYDASTDDYLVLICYRNSTHWSGRAELYSMRGNTWEEIQDIHLSYLNKVSVGYNVGLFLNGAIHWFAYRRDVSKYVILAFDLTQRNFSEIYLPDDYDHDYIYNYKFCDARVLGGFLCLYVEYSQNEQAAMWVMKEYRVQSSWTKTIIVPTGYFSPLCYTKCGDIVGTDAYTGLVKYGDKGQVKEHRPYPNDDAVGFEVAVYTESLLSLPDNKQAEQDN